VYQTPSGATAGPNVKWATRRCGTERSGGSLRGCRDACLARRQLAPLTLSLWCRYAAGGGTVGSMSPQTRHRRPRRGLLPLLAAFAIVLSVAACATDVLPAPSIAATDTASPAPASAETLTPSASSTSTPTPTPSPTQTLVPTPTIQDGPILVGAGVHHCPGTVKGGQTGGTGSQTSTNWSGYALVTSRSIITCVEAEWVQPTVRCHGTKQTSVSIWVGLGGFGQGRLVQIGTAIDCINGDSIDYSWHESLPKERREIDTPVSIKAGDRVWAQARWVGGSNYQLSLANLTDPDGFTIKSVNGGLRRTEAEWIAEAPSACTATRCRVLAMPNWGKVTFDHIGTTVNGVRTTLKATGSTRVRIRLATNGGTTRALVTHTATDGSSFVVTWRRA